MKQLLIYLLTMCFSAQLFSLDYIESSSGLNIPQLDGGRTELEFADIDADGNIDILSIGDHGSPYINTSEHGIMVWFGDGNGSWGVYQNGNFGYGGIAVGDVNNDGLLDVGYAMHHNYSSSDFGNQLIEVALGDGTGMNWTPWDDGLATNGETWGMFGTDFADVDNDGDLDIGSNSFGSGAGVHIYLNQGDGSWIQSFGFLGGNSDMDFIFGDINNDGNIDFAAKHQYGTVYFGDGTGNFVNADGNLPSYSKYGTALGDVDNDGGKDISFVTGYSNAGVKVWVWDEGQEVWTDFSGNLPTTGGYEATQLYDMNVDGYIDLCTFGNGTFTLWLGDGAGNWDQDAQFNTPLYGYCEAFRVGGDIDHNGFPDIVLVSDEGSWPSSYNHLHCFKETAVAESLTITPMSPRGNEYFIRFSTQFIDWVSAVPDDDSSLVKLEYSRFGNNGPWAMIADSLPNNGRYQWTIARISSSDCYIRYTVWTVTDTVTSITPSAFSVSSTPPATDDISINQKAFIQNYPNPFDKQTTIKFSIPKDCYVELNIYDIKGKWLKTLVNRRMKAGSHNIVWNGRNHNNTILPNGIYLYQIKIDDYYLNKKMLLLR
ncbi:MAG: FlgD immunoglobulin-like domain containing protein [Candidatus Cloacimonadota bacterium]|nr:FlgD immunoglobulin-like domain containing protein [Candidatus Cloacimonadota bacterium]